jgi:DNA invertase Pin-like site-specific DNA recombinase
MDSGVKFVAADMSNANDFMLHIYAAVAQEEPRLISQRTKAALKAAKANGVNWGNLKLDNMTYAIFGKTTYKNTTSAGEVA